MFDMEDLRRAADALRARLRRGERAETVEAMAAKVPAHEDGYRRVIAREMTGEHAESGDPVDMALSVDLDTLPLVARLETPIGYLELMRDHLAEALDTGRADRRGRVDVRVDDQAVIVTALTDYAPVTLRLPRDEVAELLAVADAVAPIEEVERRLDEELAELLGGAE